MSSNVYKKIEITGTSSESLEDAIQHACRDRRFFGRVVADLAQTPAKRS